MLLGVSLINFLHDFDASSCDENCADNPVFTPSRLVVKRGDPTSATCFVCQHCQNKTSIFGLETPEGDKRKNGTTLTWTLDRTTEWDPSVLCYYAFDDTNEQCCTRLPVTVYQPPDIVVMDIPANMSDGHRGVLKCKVSNVAPAENLTVTFYRGQTELGRLQSSFTAKTPVTEDFSLPIALSKEDDGDQFWCEAELDLGPEGPQPPPAVRSEKITATVHYKPQREGSSQPHQIVIAEGEPLHLNCTAVGNPRPSYTWTVPSEGLSPSKSSILSINSVTSAHNGQYSCLVSNNLGNVTVVFHVDVKVSNIGVIIAAVVVSVVVLAFVGVMLYINCYRRN
ncbi:cell adhesion molecule 4-like [Symphorus nematophorus]